MRTLVITLATAVAFCGLAAAESFTGHLVDATCMSQQKSISACQPTTATGSYAIEVSGKLYTLDAAGNAKASDALKNQASRSADPNQPAAPVTAKVTGTKDGDTIKVETLQIQ